MTAMKKIFAILYIHVFYKKYSITTISNFWISYLGPSNPKYPQDLNGSSRILAGINWDLVRARFELVKLSNRLLLRI